MFIHTLKPLESLNSIHIKKKRLKVHARDFTIGWPELSLHITHELELKVNKKSYGLNDTRQTKYDHGIMKRFHVAVVALIHRTREASVVVEGHCVN